MKASSAAAKALTARTVHIKLYPTPQSFPERREVLRVLERFGEVTMFRSLKYKRAYQSPIHNAFLALFLSESSATELIAASPLRYTLVSETSPSESSSSSTEQHPQAPTPEPETRTFSLNASTTSFNHHSHLTGSTNPLHGPFRPIPPGNSYIASSLQRQIPDSLWSRGLIDWETDKGEDVHDGRPDGALVSTAGEAGERNLAGLVAWERAKRRGEARPEVMFGLRGLVERREWVLRGRDEEMREGEREMGVKGEEAGNERSKDVH